MVRKWIKKQSVVFTIGILDSYKNLRNTPDEVVQALNVVTKFLETKVKQ